MGSDVFFVLMGAILVFAMHAGFAFLEVGTVREKNQVNALVKIITDFAVSVIAYFLIGYLIAYGTGFLSSASDLIAYEDATNQGFGLVKFFFLATFAAAIGAIISGGIAERMKFIPQILAVAVIIAVAYPIFEGIVWNGNFGIQDWLSDTFGNSFNDFAGSVVVHAVGGFIALGAVLQLGARAGRYGADGKVKGIPPSSIPWLALGSWLLCIGWFGFNVMSAQSLDGISGLVAMNSLMAMVGGIIAALIVGRGDPGFIHNGALGWTGRSLRRLQCNASGRQPRRRRDRGRHLRSRLSAMPEIGSRSMMSWASGRFMASAVHGAGLQPVSLA